MTAAETVEKTEFKLEDGIKVISLMHLVEIRKLSKEIISGLGKFTQALVLAIIFIAIVILLVITFLIGTIRSLIISGPVGKAIILLAVLVLIYYGQQAKDKMKGKVAKVLPITMIPPGFNGIPVVFGKIVSDVVALGVMPRFPWILDWIVLSSQPIDVNTFVEHQLSHDKALFDKVTCSLTYRITNPFKFFNMGGALDENELSKVSKTILDALKSALQTVCIANTLDDILDADEAFIQQILFTFLNRLPHVYQEIPDMPEFDFWLESYGIVITLINVPDRILSQKTLDTVSDINKEKQQQSSQELDAETKGKLAKRIEADSDGEIGPVAARAFAESQDRPDLNVGSTTLQLALAGFVSAGTRFFESMMSKDEKKK